MNGTQLKSTRKALGMSRRALAAALTEPGTTPVSLVTVWRWENDRSTIPSYLYLALKALKNGGIK